MNHTAQPVVQPLFIVAECLKEIIINDNVSQALEEIADKLYNLLEINWCYILERHGAEDTLTILQGKSKVSVNSIPCIKSQVCNLHNTPEIAEVLASGNNYKVDTNNGDKSDIPDPANIRSLLIIPVCLNKKFCGSIGFVDTNNIRDWSGIEEHLGTLSLAIGSALANHRIKSESLSSVTNQLTHLLDNIDDAYAIYDLKSHSYEFVSRNMEVLYGCDKRLFFENNLLWKERINPEDVGAVESEIEQIILKNGRGEVFYRINAFTGEEKMILEKVVVGKDCDGNAEKLYIVKTDYTNVENTEKSLIETEKKFKFISENLSDFIAIHDAKSNFTYASPSIKNILGYEPGEVIGLRIFSLIHPGDLVKTVDKALQSILWDKKECRFRFRMLDKSGEYKWVETYAKPVIDPKGVIASIISSTRDVSEQVIAENMLKEREEQYRLVSENSNDIIAIHNIQTEYIYVSPCCKQVLGYSQNELIGKKPVDVFVVKDAVLEDAFSRKDEVLKTRKGLKFLSRVVTKCGQEKLLEVWLEPVIKNNDIVALQSASRDVTEREKLMGELERTLAKERELNELRAKFVSMASHQFRTPLTVIQSGVEIMEMYLEDIPEKKQVKFQRQFKKIQEEVDRLEHLMNDVLLLGRANAARTPYNPEKGSLVEFCRNIIDNKYNQIYNVERQVVLKVEGKEVPVEFDSKLLAHSIENLLSNAYKYSQQGNVIVSIIYHTKEVRIDISDSGIGIPDQDIKNLFQPFYRATNTIEIDGTGLGLSIVKEFVEKHNGKIFLMSELNKGTTVSVILPIQ